MGMKSVSGGMLADIKAVESNLAREENRELEAIAKRFPEDHPIREELVKLKAAAGELANLPPNHPFILTLKDVKRQIEAQESPEAAEQQEQESHQRHEERRNRRNAEQQQQRVQDEQDREIRRMAASQVNHQLNKVEKELDNLYMTMEGLKDDLSGDPYTHSKLVRLERMMSVMKRTLGECKFNNTRMM
jgi:hypothetical protein